MIQFYSLDDQIKSEKDLKREIVFNLMTNVVLTSELYFLVYNLQNLANEQDIKQLKRLLSDKPFLENYLSFQILNVAPNFQFDWNQRLKFKKLDNTGEPSVLEPYALTIEALQKISRTESPMGKLDLVYTCCTAKVVEDISQFWKQYDIPSKKLAIDTDNLQGIVIYVVSRMNCPQVLSEVNMCQAFLPPAVRKSSRFIYLEMISAACSFVLEQGAKRDKLMMQKKRKSDVDENRLAFNKSICDEDEEAAEMTTSPQFNSGTAATEPVEVEFVRSNSFDMKEENTLGDFMQRRQTVQKQ